MSPATGAARRYGVPGKPSQRAGRMSRHRLGFAVKLLGGGGLPSHDTRRWQSGPHLSVSLARLRAILDRLDDLDVRMYRMATALAPYASHPDLPQFHRRVEECRDELAERGRRARGCAPRTHEAPPRRRFGCAVTAEAVTDAVAGAGFEPATFGL